MNSPLFLRRSKNNVCQRQGGVNSLARLDGLAAAPVAGSTAAAAPVAGNIVAGNTVAGNKNCWN